MRNYIVVLLMVFIYAVPLSSEAAQYEFLNSIGKVEKDRAIPMHGTNASDHKGSLKFSSNSLLKLPSPNSVNISRIDKSQIKFSSWCTHESVNPGDDFVVVVKIDLDEGWYVYGKGETTGLVTNLILLSGEFSVINQGLSQSLEKKTSLGSKLLISNYLVSGSYAWIRLKLREDLVLASNTKLKLRLKYQLCSDSVCLLPKHKDLIVPIGIGQRKLSRPSEQFRKAQSLFQSNKTLKKEGLSNPDVPVDHLTELIGQNAILALFMAFLWGLLASLTPCVYPMIPITVSLFSSGMKSDSRFQKFIYACFYVAGITLVYAILGVATSYTGRDLGSWLAEPIVVIPISILMVLLACSMFGLFDMDLPNSVKTRLNNIEGRSPLALFLMGAAMGFVAAPCVGPFAGSIILWLAKNPGSPIFGFLLMAAFGLGMGCLFLFIAVFSQSFLPRSGLWMVNLKQAMGYVLIGMAYYFISILMPEDKVILGWALYLMIAGGLMGAFAQLKWEEIWWKHLLKTCGIILFLIGCLQCLMFVFSNSDISQYSKDVKTSAYIYTDFNSAIKEAKKSRKPLFLYFGARWCIPCKKIKAVVLEDQSVKQLLNNFVVAYLDCTDGASESARIKEDRFNSHSMPFFAFFNSDGKHLKELDIHGAVNTKNLLDQLSKVK